MKNRFIINIFLIGIAFFLITNLVLGWNPTGVADPPKMGHSLNELGGLKNISDLIYVVYQKSHDDYTDCDNAANDCTASETILSEVGKCKNDYLQQGSSWYTGGNNIKKYINLSDGRINIAVKDIIDRQIIMINKTADLSRIPNYIFLAVERECQPNCGVCYKTFKKVIIGNVLAA